jgi:hypothetical protein
MREECKHFESRTYANRETVRKCNLDLAPEAPWRCPADCPRYAPRMADVNWQHGKLIIPPSPPEPPRLDESVTALLDEAEEVVNAAGPGILAELALEDRRPPRPATTRWWSRWRRRSR